MPRPKQRTPALRDHVAAVALATLEADGLAALTARGVADGAGTSTAAVYELFGDKPGLVRHLCFAGFRMLHDELAGVPVDGDPRADLVALLRSLRSFALAHPALTDLMFGRPLAEFLPGPDDLAVGAAAQRLVLDRVRACIEAGALDGRPIDVAHVVLAVVQGLAAQERAGWLGTSLASVERRWALAVDAVLDGLAP